MASINSLMGGSSTSSIFGSRNVISGLASGMDTEGMIENAVSGYKMKISNLQQRRMKMEWQQNAYRSIIEKMVRFNQKYLTYASGNNLMSGAFFDSAVKTTANGANAGKVSVSGRTTNDVVIHSATMATSQRYTTKMDNLRPSNEATQAFDVTGTQPVGKLEGGLELGYGGKTIRISFNSQDVYKDAQEMADAINKKLADQTITFDDGGQAKASDKIQAVVKDNTITFETVKKGDSNGVWISGASTKLEEALSIKPETDKKDLTSFTFDPSKVKEDRPIVDVLSEKGFTVNVNGVTKTIKGPTKEELGNKLDSATYIKALQEKLNEAFGKQAPKVYDVNAGDDAKMITLGFKGASESDRIEVGSAAGKLIGMESSLSSHIQAGRKLGDLLNIQDWDKWRMEVAADKVTPGQDDFGTDADGNRVKKADDGKWYRVDKDGNDLYSFKLNGKEIGTFTKESSLQDVINQVNKSENSAYKINYSRFTNSFMIEAKATGEVEPLEMDADGLSGALFTSLTEHSKGQNAKAVVSVNGIEKEVVQGSNTLEIDGLTVTLKGDFSKNDEPITFSTTSDPDKVVEVVKSMVEDYNAMATEIKKAYSTIPLLNTSGKPYEPLTDEQRADMSESEIKTYEERAKTGVLFADRELSNLYRDMTQVLGALGVSGNDALKLGLTTSYEDGTTTMHFDEEQFRKTMEADPEKVKKLFASSVENGDTSNGLMVGLKDQLEKYASTTGAVKGILIEKAGSALAPTSVMQNTMQQKLDSFDKQVEALRAKMSKQVDYYNRKFTALEQMIMQMNNQSSTLMGLAGGF